MGSWVPTHYEGTGSIIPTNESKAKEQARPQERWGPICRVVCAFELASNAKDCPY